MNRLESDEIPYRLRRTTEGGIGSMPIHRREEEDCDSKEDCTEQEDRMKL